MDVKATQIIKNLEKEFCVVSKEFEDNIFDQSIGIEIEIKFRNAFPSIFQDYVLTKNYNPINDLIKDKEGLYKKTIDCGIPRGLDKYWEFAFEPVHNTSLLLKQIDILKQVGLIPSGDHSLHITIGGVDRSEKSYWIMLILELLFIDKKRLLEYGWTKKGRGGILERLYNGYEIRTLSINRETDMIEMFRTLKFLLENKSWIKDIKEKVISLGLKNEIWYNDDIIEYHKKFEELSIFIKKFKCN